MAQEPGLGGAQRYLTADIRWPSASFRAKRTHGHQGFSRGRPKPLPGLRGLLFLFGNWPRFTTEDDDALDLIPEKFVNDRLSGMRCDGDRCTALSGQIGIATACTIYAVRPEVCRTCMPGDAECAMARRRHGLPALT